MTSSKPCWLCPVCGDLRRDAAPRPRCESDECRYVPLMISIHERCYNRLTRHREGASLYYEVLQNLGRGIRP